MVDLSKDREPKKRAPSAQRKSRKSAHSSVPRPVSVPRATKGDAASNRKRELDLALALMHFAFRKMIEEPDRLLALRGLGRVHHRVLFFVARRPGLSVGELLSVLAVSKQSLHRPMQKLASLSLLVSGAHPDNRRIKRLYLTRKGLAFEDKLSGIQRDLFRRAFGTRGSAAELGFRAVLHDVGEGRAIASLNGSSPRVAEGKSATR